MKVYYLKEKSLDEKKLSEGARRILETMVDEENLDLEECIPIKVHFGEKGNTSYIKAQAYDGVIDYLEEKGIESSFIESNVLYRGARTTRDSHLALAKDHGFTRIPVIIADGDHGEEFDEIPIPGDFFDKVKIARGYAPYEQILVMAHFKGHAEAGFGGGVKQLGMGFAARGGKMAQHAALSPRVEEEDCIACGACVEGCNYDAITIEETAFIHEDKCVGCAACVALCPTGAVKSNWEGAHFKEKLAEYALGASQGKKFIYINFVSSITALCDCVGKHMDPVASNVGILGSLDPVALDRACIDLLQNEHPGLFEEGRLTLEHGEKIGLGSQQYQLCPLD